MPKTSNVLRKFATKAKKGLRKLTKIITPKKSGFNYTKAGFLFTNPEAEAGEATELLVKKKDIETKFGLDFLIIRSDSRGNYEIQSDKTSQITKHLLTDCHGYKDLGDAIAFGQSNAQLIVKTIVSQVTNISHLWIDTTHNASIMQAIIDIFAAPYAAKAKQRLNLEQLTVVGCVRHNDIDTLCSFVLLCRRCLCSVRLRHCRLHSHEQSVRFWTAMSQCSRLAQLQYEPCRQDVWSLPHLVTALEKKPIRSLILTGIQGLDSSNLWKICKSPDLMELAVVGDCIGPETYGKPEAEAVLSRLRNLLIQIDETFNMDDPAAREILLKILSRLDETSVLEVIHMVRGGSCKTSRVIGYWSQLASDSSRHIQLKLEGCAQECQDAAVGRLLRRYSTATKVTWSLHGLGLSLGSGTLTLLDYKSWFGDDI